MLEQSCHVNLAICLYRIDAPPSEGELTVIFYITLEYCMKIMLSFSFTEICQFQQLRVFLDNIQTAHWLFQCDKKQIKLLSLKSASNLNGNLNCSKELEHYAS